MCRGWLLLGFTVLSLVVIQGRSEPDSANDILTPKDASIRDSEGELRVQRSAGEKEKLKGALKKQRRTLNQKKKKAKAKRKNKNKSGRKVKDSKKKRKSGKNTKKKKSNKSKKGKGKKKRNKTKSGRSVKTKKKKQKLKEKTKKKNRKTKRKGNNNKSKTKSDKKVKKKKSKNNSKKKAKKGKKKENERSKSSKKKNNREKIKTLNTASRQNNARKNKKEKPDSKKKQASRQTENRPQCTFTASNNTHISDQCLKDALLSLNYERNQVTNYIKQSARLKNHARISKNKLNKRDEFSSAAKHMLWAIGGNFSDPKCGEESENKSSRQQRGMVESVNNYHLLINCTHLIHAACDIEQHNETNYNESDHDEHMDKCNALKKDFITVSKECISAKDQGDAKLQCECWAKAAKDVVDIKKEKCETKKHQKTVTKHKNQCTKAFGICKKAEDSAIELIHKCMHDHSADFINLTAKGLQDSALDAKSTEIEKSVRGIAGSLLYKLS